MASRADYCTTGDVGMYNAQISSDTGLSTSLLPTLITSASRAIDSYTNRQFTCSTADETLYFRGSGSCRWVPPFDIASITSLSIASDSVKASSGAYTSISTGDFALMPDTRSTDAPALWVELAYAPSASYNSTAPYYNYFPDDLNTIKFVGKRGYSNSTSSTGIPRDVNDAAVRTVIRWLRSINSGGADVQGLDALESQPVPRTLPADVRMTLDHYRRPGIA